MTESATLHSEGSKMALVTFHHFFMVYNGVIDTATKTAYYRRAAPAPILVYRVTQTNLFPFIMLLPTVLQLLGSSPLYTFSPVLRLKHCI